MGKPNSNVQELNIDVYADGYSTLHTNCFDISLAGGTGLYRCSNYFDYLFLIAVNSNWASDDAVLPTDFYQFRVPIFKRLGLNFSESTVRDSNDLVLQATDRLANQCPCLVFLKYNACFYNEFYKEAPVNHTLLLSGFDNSKETITTREFIHIRECISTLTRADMLCKLKLTYPIFQNMWELSNVQYAETEPEYANKLYWLEADKQQPINPINPISELIAALSRKRNTLEEIIENFNNDRSRLQGMSMMITRTAYYGALEIIFESVERAANIADNKEWATIKREYSIHRDTLLSKLDMDNQRAKTYDHAEIQSLIGEVQQWDKRLLTALRECVGNYER